MTDPAEIGRFELKYLVDEQRARAIGKFVREYLVEDQFNDPKRDNIYRVNSLYFDSSDLALRNASLDMKDDRFKLRVRFYDDQPAGTVFTEIKDHEKRLIHKQRAMVRRADALGTHLRSAIWRTRTTAWQFSRYDVFAN